MFGGLGGALKNLTGKAEEMMEKTKKNVEEMAAEKKAAAQAMLESQVKKTGDAFSMGKGEVDKAASDGKLAAIDGLDAELGNVERAVESSVEEKKEEKSESVPSSIDPSNLAQSTFGGIDQVDKQIEKALDGAMKHAGVAVDSKIKEADQFIDEKREEVVQQIQGEANKTSDGASQGVSSILGKAKGFLNF